jgi:hypothetical protein
MLTTGLLTVGLLVGHQLSRETSRGAPRTTPEPRPSLELINHEGVCLAHALTEAASGEPPTFAKIRATEAAVSVPLTAIFPVRRVTR